MSGTSILSRRSEAPASTEEIRAVALQLARKVRGPRPLSLARTMLSHSIARRVVRSSQQSRDTRTALASGRAPTEAA